MPNLIVKSHTAPNDIAKLASLTPDDADTVAFLRIVFDEVAAPADDDIALRARLTQLDTAPWFHAHQAWNDPYRPGERVVCHWWSHHLRQPPQQSP